MFINIIELYRHTVVDRVAVYTGCANKNNPLEKRLYFSNCSTDLGQNFKFYM